MTCWKHIQLHNSPIPRRAISDFRIGSITSFANVTATSALPPIATEERTSICDAKGQFRTLSIHCGRANLGASYLSRRSMRNWVPEESFAIRMMSVPAARSVTAITGFPRGNGGIPSIAKLPSE